ncbi:MAG TPA: hypothetical protein VL691_09570 [Vicinamibacteria bacterium]|nr:hypothetical protein [Vicinamibacteria bacterium]
MKTRCWLTATVVAALLAPGVARAEGLEGRFSIVFQAGTQSEISGDLIKGAEGDLLGKPTTIETKRYRDVYAPDLRLQGLVGYGIGRKVEIIARGTYYKANGTALEVGTFNGHPLAVYFEPDGAYEEVGVEVGVRYYLASAGRLKSYVAPVVGARFLSEVLVTFSVQEAGTSIQNVPFSQKSTVPVFGVDLGFTFDFGSHFFAGLESALRYQSPPKQFDGLLGFTQIDNSDGKWSAPVVASVGVRF